MHGLALLASTLLTPAAPDFDTEVLPVLTKAGCNAGACHGSALGRGGFKLSLWGSDPDADHRAIVRELEGRRVNLADPYESLLIQKPTGGVRHGGRILIDGDGPGVARLLAWLEAGAPRQGKRRLVRLDVTPEEHVLSRPGEALQVRVAAHFNDGTEADATPWAVFQADDPATVNVSDSGRVAVSRRGQATVMVRFLDQVKAVRLLVPVGDTPVDLSAAPRHNFIDDEVLATLATLRLPVAPPADDHAFLRRVSLDLTGTLPTPERVRAFVADTREDKRARLIDELLASEAFVDYWTLQWANLLRIRSQELGPEGVSAFHGWVRGQVKANRPLDAMAREMLLALGDAREVGPANFSRVPRTPRDQAEYVSEVFLGVRLRCANCHDHPLDRWRQDDYHGLAAVFANLERGPVVRLAARGEVIHPRTEEPARLRIPGERFLGEGEDGREALADWLTGPDNPYFAKAAVNRLWKELFGRGLVDPADDLRATNPATHPRLLDRLAEDFVKHGHDVRHTLRLIANSAAYQRGPVRAGSVSDGLGPVAERFYACASARPLPAEVLADAIVSVTGVSDRYGALPEGTRAITLPDPAIPAPGLDVLGRCSREGSCEAETVRGGGLARVLHLINGPLLNRKVEAEPGRLRQLLDKGGTNAEVVEGFYLRALGRPPREKERVYWAEHLPGEDPGRREALEDFLWALLTCEEFVTNH